MIIDRLRIIGFDYEVRDVPNLMGAPMESFGVSSENTQEIEVDAGLSFQAKRETLLHEALHQIAEAGGLDFEECEVRGLSRLLDCFLQDNPHFVALWDSAKEASNACR